MNNTRPDNTLAVVGLVIGIISLLISAIPCVGILGGMSAVVGLILGGIAYFKAKDNGDPLTLSLVASIVSALAIALAVYWFVTIRNATKSVEWDVETKEYANCDSLVADFDRMKSDIARMEEEFENAESVSVLGNISKLTRLAISVEKLAKKAEEMGCEGMSDYEMAVDSLSTKE